MKNALFIADKANLANSYAGREDLGEVVIPEGITCIGDYNAQISLRQITNQFATNLIGLSHKKMW